jgi:integrase
LFLLAQLSVFGSGRARQLCPGISDLDFLRNLNSVIISMPRYRTVLSTLCVSKQELDRTRRVWPKAGVPANFHDLRRTGCRIHARCWRPINVYSKQLGHSDSWHGRYRDVVTVRPDAVGAELLRVETQLGSLRLAQLADRLSLPSRWSVV